MKKELVASVLTFTAGMASTVSFPQVSLAKAPTIEREFKKQFLLVVKNRVRHTTPEGKVIMGHIYMSLEQEPSTPDANNQLHGEMTGSLYFESDESIDGHKHFIALAGDDGEVLLDQTHRSKDGNVYQVYGCNSTRTECNADSYQVFFNPNKQVTMNLNIALDLKLEIETQVKEGFSDWSTRTWNAEMIEWTKKK